MAATHSCGLLLEVCVSFSHRVVSLLCTLPSHLNNIIPCTGSCRFSSLKTDILNESLWSIKFFCFSFFYVLFLSASSLHSLMVLILLSPFNSHQAFAFIIQYWALMFSVVLRLSLVWHLQESWTYCTAVMSCALEETVLTLKKCSRFSTTWHCKQIVKCVFSNVLPIQ